MRIMKGDLLLENKKAKIRFKVIEEFTAGMELLGGEVKTLRAKRGSLDGARVVARGGQAYLTGMTIPQYQGINNYEEDRPRRLLLKKDEIEKIANAEDRKGLTTVPFEVYNNRYIKVRVAIVEGKNKRDRREDIKKREAGIEMGRVLKRKR